MNQEPALRRSLLFAFALPSIMLGFTHAPEANVQGIYAKYAGLSLSAIAAAMLFSRMFDALTYPLIGQLSDLTYRKTGSRKPWIAAGTVVMVTGLWFLYRPPPGVSISYFATWMIVCYVGWKLTEIPLGAWSYALSGDYAQRARIQLWRTMAGLVGGVVFLVVPAASKALGWAQTTDMNLQTLSLTAVLIVFLVPLLNAWSLLRVPDGTAPPPATHSIGIGDWRGMINAVAGSAPLRRFLLAVVPISFLLSMAVSVNFLFIDTYLKLSDKYATIMLIATPLALLGLPFWGWVCMRFERHRAFAVALVLAATSFSLIGFAPVGPDGYLLVVVTNAVANFCLGGLGIAVPSMMGDIVDDERLRSGEDRGGLFYAMMAFMTRSINGVSTALGLFLLDLSGFDATAAVQSADGALGIRLISAWLPMLGAVLGAVLLWNFPIDRARQEATHAALLARDGARTAA